MVFLCNRGCVNLREMTLDNCNVVAESGGHRYICISNKLTNCHCGDTGDETSQKSRTYDETLGLSTCPVSSFEKYINNYIRIAMHFNKNQTQTSIMKTRTVGDIAIHQLIHILKAKK